jgi:hypothetical protein
MLNTTDPANPSAEPAEPCRLDTRIPILFLLVPPAHVAAAVIFFVLRDHQLSLPDPYNNPYTNWSTGFLLSAGALWVLGGIWTILRARSGQLVPKLVVVWLVLATLPAALFLIQMLAFIYP